MSSSKNQQLKGQKAVEQTDPAPESDNQLIPFQPVMIFAAQRNTNSSSPPTKMVAQREPAGRCAHLKMKSLSKIGVRKSEGIKIDQSEHPNIIWEKNKVAAEEKSETNGVERVKVQEESVNSGFLNDFTTLNLDEIEDDLFLMSGKRPPRNPMMENPFKGNLHPGNRLDEICAAIDVIEGEAALRKNQRGQ